MVIKEDSFSKISGLQEGGERRLYSFQKEPKVPPVGGGIVKNESISSVQ